MSTSKEASSKGTVKPPVKRRAKVSPEVKEVEVVVEKKVTPLPTKIALGVLVVGIIIMLYLYFSKSPTPDIVSDHTAAQKAYERQHQSDSATIAFKDSIGLIAIKEANYWKGVAQEKELIIINNRQLYLQNEKKYQNIINGIKPIIGLDSLKDAIKPKY